MSLLPSRADYRNGNYTLDDAAPSITYQGFTASANSPPPIKKDKNAAAFYKGTISYTSSSSATASFTFANSLLQIYGPIGPAFGTFSVRVDQADCGSYSANRQEDSDGKAVLLWTGQFQPGQHQVQITNMQDGQSLALDYMVADGQANADWIGATGPAAPGPMQPDAGVFGAPKSEGKSSVGAIIGGILAALFIFVSTLTYVGLHVNLTGSLHYYSGGACVSTEKRVEKDQH